jgi:hypothetical protein
MMKIERAPLMTRLGRCELLTQLACRQSIVAKVLAPATSRSSRGQSSP